MSAAPAREPIRAGELTTPWRVAVVALWVGVVVALAAVWNTSVQLGLSTWWLGPRGAPRPAPVHVIPFVAPTLMCLAAFANLRRLWLLGLGAAAITAVVGVIDLWFVPGLGVIELAIAVCAALVSLASRTGTYRAAG